MYRLKVESPDAKVRVAVSPLFRVKTPPKLLPGSGNVDGAEYPVKDRKHPAQISVPVAHFRAVMHLMHDRADEHVVQLSQRNWDMGVPEVEKRPENGFDENKCSNCSLGNFSARK